MSNTQARRKAIEKILNEVVRGYDAPAKDKRIDALESLFSTWMKEENKFWRKKNYTNTQLVKRWKTECLKLRELYSKIKSPLPFDAPKDVYVKYICPPHESFNNINAGVGYSNSLDVPVEITVRLLPKMIKGSRRNVHT